MKKVKNIGLIAHDGCKKDMTEWVAFNAKRLSVHNLVCTGTTGKLIEEVYKTKFPELKANITKLKSGPLGGDQQMGALIASDQLDILIFFTDPMTMQPHDVDIKALIRLSAIGNIVVACTRSSADFIISSPLFETEYEAIKDEHENYVKRNLR
ncbi:MAG: methylglyoxal synthase [Elusimicrobiota bacterium]|jgi:methylglyoxal synthase|nr:methylglyoxal synthase [Elusimicrobiota bacterium]